MPQSYSLPLERSKTPQDKPLYLTVICPEIVDLGRSLASHLAGYSCEVSCHDAPSQLTHPVQSQIISLENVSQYSNLSSGDDHTFLRVSLLCLLFEYKDLSTGSVIMGLAILSYFWALPQNLLYNF